MTIARHARRKQPGAWSALAGRLAALGFLLVAAGCARETGDGIGRARAGRPDVIVILIDTLRPDHLGIYGYERETAPYLAHLSSRSAVFTRAFSTSSWTAPATASLFTSLYPRQHGVVEGFFARRRREGDGTAVASIDINRLTDSQSTLPEILKELGYATYGLAANPNIGREMGFDRGFDRFERLHGAERLTDETAETLYEKLLEWEHDIRRSAPNFVYLHFNDVHRPYEKRAPWYEPRGDSLDDERSAYDSEIGYVDHFMKKIMERFGWDENAILVVLSDHGEEFLEHGGLGHKFTLYDELLRILLMIRTPDPEIVPHRVEENVSIVDVMPTLIELLDERTDPSRAGRSLAPLLRSGPGADALHRALRDRPLLAHRLGSRGGQQELWGLIQDDWKIIEGPHGGEMYDLSRDPREQQNLWERDPATASRLAALLEELKGPLPHGTPQTHRIEMDPEDAEALRRLGYVD